MAVFFRWTIKSLTTVGLSVAMFDLSAHEKGRLRRRFLTA
jgi:hypothetical protein